MDSAVRTSIVMAIIFAVSQLGAIAMAASVLGTEVRLFKNPDDPLIPLYYIAAILLFTFASLYVIKKKRENVVKIIFLGAVIYTIFFVLLVTMSKVLNDLAGLLLALAVTAVLGYYLVKKPEWYVIDATGVLMSVGIIGIFGISLSILPVLVLLIVLAIYDAVSVYGTKHMIALAEGVTKMRLPILLVIPKKKGYSYLTQRPLMEKLPEGEEREAMFMGLGDIIIPGVLVVSAFSFLPELTVEGVSGALIVALGTIVGALSGFAALMTFVMKGRPQAGLPLLNGGAMIGYALTYLAVYQDLSFGITWPW
jgi:presenilin-like A22 family membrane protease